MFSEGRQAVEPQGVGLRSRRARLSGQRIETQPESARPFGQIERTGMS
jgi:hypothetical protein